MEHPAGTSSGTSQAKQCIGWGHGQPAQVVLLVKNPPASAGVMGCRLDPWVGKIPCRRALQPIPMFLENPMDKGACQATVHRVTKNQAQLK